jgi:hypothetical protein
MADVSTVELEGTERDEHLGSGGVGVVSFDTPGEAAPHSIPVSYGYDATDETFYFRLAVPSEGEKTDLVDRPVSFVVHGSADGRWWSVVASGRLEHVEDDAVGTDALAGLDRSHIPLFDVFGRPPSEVPFRFYRLVPDDLTGRAESVPRT